MTDECDPVIVWTLIHVMKEFKGSKKYVINMINVVTPSGVSNTTQYKVFFSTDGNHVIIQSLLSGLMQNNRVLFSDILNKKSSSKDNNRDIFHEKTMI